jgi:transcriptional regulator of acetoin/glycerol metabolism
MFSDPAKEAAVTHAWESFLSGAPHERPADILRSLVDVSWQRCLEAQVDPRRRRGPQPLSAQDLSLLCERQRDLMQASAPVMASARDFLVETGTLMAVAGTDGTILNTEGDWPAIDSAEAIRLVPGAQWTEGLCGTNAIGTALALGQPVQVHSSEHFCEGIKRWTCSATVIHDPADGEVAGVLDVSGLSETYSRHTLALVVASASRIESRLAMIQMERRYRLLDRATGRLTTASGDGVVLLDWRGFPIKLNKGGQAAMVAAGAGASSLAALGRIPGLAAASLGRDVLPAWIRPGWIEPRVEKGEHLGTLLVIPGQPQRLHMLPRSAPSADASGAARETCPASAAGQHAFTGLVTEDPAVLAAMARARQLARARVPVLLLGETGVGKEEFARGMHTGGPFVVLNCGGLSRELLASELFGYAEGAFTGARKSGMVGKIEAAHGGTLFLDEIGEMPADMQPHLLRVLEQGEIYRIGENTPRHVDFRLIAATHRDLPQQAQAGVFRMDLYYRIAVTTLRIPPLRQRSGDVALLARHFLAHFRQLHGIGPGTIAPQALQALGAYAWPGNVRELRSVIEGAVLLDEGPVLTCASLPPEITQTEPPPPTQPLQALAADAVPSMEQGETLLIRHAIEASHGNLTQAAHRLNIAKSTLYAKMKRYGLSR